MVILNPSRREKIFIKDRPDWRIPTTKIHEDGLAYHYYDSRDALLEWAILSYDSNAIIYLYENKDKWMLVDGSGRALTDVEAGYLINESNDYKDITQEMFDTIVNTESIASPEDFRDMNIDMGVPTGFIYRLHQIWMKKCSQV